MLKHTRNLLTRLRKDTRGLTAVEYAVLGAMVVGAIGLVGTQFNADLTAAFGAMFD